MEPIYKNPFSWISIILGAVAVLPFLVLSYLNLFVEDFGLQAITFALQGGFFLTPIAGLIAILAGALGIIRTHTHPGSHGEVLNLMGMFLGVIGIALFVFASASLGQAVLTTGFVVIG